MLNGSSQKVFTVSAASDRGLVREKNEDYYGIFEPETDELMDEKGLLIVVADGMGGHLSGGRASRMAVEVMGEVYFGQAEGNPADKLADALDKANSDIFENIGEGKKWVAGTTCTAAVIFPDHFHLAHAGDSRAYLLGKGGIKQLTDDHSAVGEMLREGILNKEEARKHPRRNVITRAVGLNKNIKVDIIESIPFKTGETLMICSDGLTSMLPEDEIGSIISSNEPDKACQLLVKKALEAGGEDNVTLVIIRKN